MRILFFLTIFCTSLSFAADKNLKKGDWLIGGAAGYQKVVSSSEAFYIVLGPKYFIMDALSVGIYGRFQKQPSLLESLELGPSVRYFLYEMEEWAFYLDQSVAHKYYMIDLIGTRVENGLIGISSIGASYFFNSSVSFGPSFSYSYKLGSSNLTGLESRRFDLNFSVYF